MALSAEQIFAALLRASFKKVFEEDASITAELLKEQLYKDDADMNVNAVRGLLNLCSNLLRQAGFEGELSQDALHKSKLSASQQDVFQRFWATQKDNAHKILADKSRLHNKLKSFQWRVDSSASSEKSEPTAIVEMVIAGQQQKQETVHFEMNPAQLKDVLATMDDLKKVLEEKTQQNK